MHFRCVAGITSESPFIMLRLVRLSSCAFFVGRSRYLSAAAGWLVGLGMLVNQAHAALTVTRVGGTLTILGDNLTGDVISVSQNLGTITVLPGGQTFQNIITLRIDTRGSGPDRVVLQNLDLDGALSVKTGQLDSRVAVSNCSVDGAVTFTSGAGGDLLDVMGLNVGGSLSVSAGNGTTLVSLAMVQADGLVNILTGNGGDDVSFGPMTSIDGALSVNTGAGNDSVILGTLSQVGGTLTVYTGSGLDEVMFDQFHQDSLGTSIVDTGDGEDYVASISATDFKSSLIIRTGNQSDAVDLGRGLGIGGSLGIDTGAGSDSVVLTGSVETFLDLTIATGLDGDRVKLLRPTGAAPAPHFSVGRDLRIDLNAGDDRLGINYDELVPSTTYNPVEVVRHVVIGASSGADAMILHQLDCLGRFGYTDSGLAGAALVDDCTIGAAASMTFGVSNDMLGITASRFGSTVYVNGGRGTDSLNSVGNTFVVPPQIVSFELR